VTSGLWRHIGALALVNGGSDVPFFEWSCSRGLAATAWAWAWFHVLSRHIVAGCWPAALVGASGRGKEKNFDATMTTATITCTSDRTLPSTV
jgi:hypothetical protein